MFSKKLSVIFLSCSIVSIVQAGKRPADNRVVENQKSTKRRAKKRAKKSAQHCDSQIASALPAAGDVAGEGVSLLLGLNASPVSSSSSTYTDRAALPSGPAVLREARLLQAARWGDVATIKSLLRGGIDINAADGDMGVTALMVASGNHGLSEVVKVLVEHRGIDINLNNCRNGLTALMYAVGCGDSESVKVLLNAGADVHKVSSHNSNALKRAVYDIDTRPEIVEMLMKAGAYIENEWFRELPEAQKEKFIEISKRLGVESRRVPGSQSRSSARQLAYRVSPDSEDILNWFSALNVSRVHYNGGTRLHVAVYQGSLEEVQRLLGAGTPDLHKKDRSGATPLKYAVDNICLFPDIVEALMRAGACIGREDRWFHHCSERQKGELQRITQKIYASSAGSMSQAPHGSHAVSSSRGSMSWVFYGSPAVSSSAGSISQVSHGSPAVSSSTRDVSQDSGGLHSGAPMLFTRTRLGSQVNINQGDSEGVTPLMKAVKGGNIEDVKRLLEAGALVGLKDKTGSSALKYAVDSIGSKPGIVRILMEKSLAQTDGNTTGIDVWYHVCTKAQKSKLQEILTSVLGTSTPSTSTPSTFTPISRKRRRKK